MRAALFGDSLQLFFWSIEKVYKQLKQWNQKTLNTFNRINKYENIEMVYAMGLCVFGFAAYISTRYGWTGYVIYETYSGKRERVGEQKGVKQRKVKDQVYKGEKVNEKELHHVEQKELHHLKKKHVKKKQKEL
eukprot:93428_1